MDKKDYIWLTRNTEIDNVCDIFEDCNREPIILKLFRKSHLPKLKTIFADHDVEIYEDKQENFYVEVSDLTISGFCEIAMQCNSDLIYKRNQPYYIPTNRNILINYFWHKSAQQLSALSPQKKLDILFALEPDSYVGEKKHSSALNKQSDKLNALLDLPIPQAFWEREQRKIRLIAAKIATIPNIKEKLENFAELDRLTQQKLLKHTAAITAHYSGIQTPKLFLVSQKEMRQLAGSGWKKTDAINIEKDIYIAKSWLKKQSGIRCLALAWHETNHVAMSFGDYSQFALMEDIMNPRLQYTGDVNDSYIMYPQEKINYALEKQFIEECVARTGIKKLGNTYAPSAEFDVATQYIARSLQKKY